MPEFYQRKEALIFYSSISPVFLIERVEPTNFFGKKESLKHENTVF